MPQTITEKIKLWLQEDHAAKSIDNDYQCQTRDVFQAKLDNLYSEIKDPLIIAVCGEIGNNAFDHNLGNWKDIPGIYFRSFISERLIVIADRGQGIKKTLGRVVDKINIKQRNEIFEFQIGY